MCVVNKVVWRYSGDHAALEYMAVQHYSCTLYKRVERFRLGQHSETVSLPNNVRAVKYRSVWA